MLGYSYCSSRASGQAFALSALLLAAAPTIRADDLTVRLLADASDGRLDEHGLIESALIASGVDDRCELTGWLGFHGERRAAIVADVAATPTDEQLPAIHAALHRHWLTGRYRREASDLRAALADGDFNCLTSLALYVDLCAGLEIELEICSLPGHVFLRSTGETTTVIEPGARRWSSNAPLEPDRLLEAANRRSSAGRRITPVELLGKLYYNRAIERLEQRDYAAGIELLGISLRLDPADADARQNLLAGLNNWAAERCRAERYDEAAALIAQGLRLSPRFGPLLANQRLVRQMMGK